MTRKSLRRLLIGVALLGAGYGVTLLVGGSGQPGKPEGPVPEALRRASASRLDSVRIDGPMDTVVLRQGKSGWRVNGYRADSSEIAALRRAVDEGASLELVSRNAANHGQMGVDSASARRAVFGFERGEPATLLVGDPGPYASTVYARVPGTDPVHLVGGQFGRLVRRRADDWRERTIVSLDTSEVAAVAVRRPDTTYRLRRASGTWRLDGAAADTARAGGLLDGLAGLEATGFAPDSLSVGRPDRTVTVLGPTARDTLVRLRLERTGSNDGGQFLAAVEGRAGVFELPTARADRVAPAPRALAGGSGGGEDG